MEQLDLFPEPKQPKNKHIDQIVDKYIKQIEIESAGFVPNDYGFEADDACLSLILPIKMLDEYKSIKGIKDELPDGKEFWKETDLANKLYNDSRKMYCQTRDVLEFLRKDVGVSYQKFYSSSDKIRLYINEVQK